MDQIYKLYVRPHLDYGDIVYHTYDPQMHLNFMQHLERTQYCAALVVTGAWRGAIRERLYQELGWEDLYHSRWNRQACHFHTLVKSHSPKYVFSELPPEHNISYNLRNVRVAIQNVGRTARYSNTYCQNALIEWNMLNDEARKSKSISDLKHKLLITIRPEKSPIYSINDILGARHLSKS